MLRHRLPVVLAAVLTLVLLSNCGAAPEPETIIERAQPEATMAVRTVVEEVAVEAEVVKEVPAEDRPAGTNEIASLEVPRSQRMIIKDADMELLVSDTDVALDSVTVIAVDYGGYIISTHTWYEDGFKYATVRLGCRSRNLRTCCAACGGWPCRCSTSWLRERM